MNSYGLGVLLVVLVTLLVAVPLGLKYSQAVLLFGFIAVSCSPLVIHRVPDKNWAIGLLVGLAIFGSFPIKKLYQIEGFLNEALVTLVYLGLLWVLGLGWRRNWR